MIAEQLLPAGARDEGGKNIVYDFQNSKGDQDLLGKLAKTLIQGKPDLIVTSSTTASVPIAKVTAGTDLPVVFLAPEILSVLLRAMPAQATI